jgi:hypothetical protein
VAVAAFARSPAALAVLAARSARLPAHCCTT